MPLLRVGVAAVIGGVLGGVTQHEVVASSPAPTLAPDHTLLFSALTTLSTLGAAAIAAVGAYLVAKVRAGAPRRATDTDADDIPAPPPPLPHLPTHHDRVPTAAERIEELGRLLEASVGEVARKEQTIERLNAQASEFRSELNRLRAELRRMQKGPR